MQLTSFHTHHMIKGLLFTALFVFVSLTTGVAQTEIDGGYQKLEQFSIDANALNELKITNSHGRISVEGWTENTISVDVQISVLSTDLTAASDVFAQFGIQSEQIKNQHVFITTFSPDFYSNLPFSVDYIIRVPEHLNLNINNAFGDVSIKDTKGLVVLDMEYGVLNINNLKSLSKVPHQFSLRYTQGLINTGNYISCKSSNCNLVTSNVKQWVNTSEYSLQSLTNVQNIKMTGFTDRVTITQCDSLTLSGKQLITHVEMLNKQGHFELQDGQLSISTTGELISLEVANDDVLTSVILPINLSYLLNGEVEDGDFNHSASDQLRIFKDSERISFSGTVGDVKNVTAKIVTIIKNSDLTFQNK